MRRVLEDMVELSDLGAVRKADVVLLAPVDGRNLPARTRRVAEPDDVARVVAQKRGGVVEQACADDSAPPPTTSGANSTTEKSSFTKMRPSGSVEKMATFSVWP